MKTKIISAFFVISLIILASCNWIDPALNVDPTSPKDASFSTILPTTQIGLAYVLGGDVGRFTSLFTQHHKGVARQHQLLYSYALNESDLDNAWTTIYTGPMTDWKIMMEKADNESSPHYKGVSQILMAYTLGMFTDLFGDIPYSAALNGEASKKPVYDTQEQIYNTIQTLLTEGIANCGAASSISKPGADDFIYGGDMTKWIKAAHTLKARFYLHVKDYPNAMTELAAGFTGNDDDMAVYFGESESTANPFYQFATQRGDISMGPGLMNLMGGLKDPRIVTYTDDTVYSEDAYVGTFFASPNSPVFFITFAEAKFIEAECKLASSDAKGANDAYLAGVQASLEKFGIDGALITAYMADPKVDVGQNALTLKTIIEQKYIALYSQHESWTDWRRTGYPVINPVTPPSVPRRFIYPQAERLYNGANLQNATGYKSTPDFIFTKMWWDTKW